MACLDEEDGRLLANDFDLDQCWLESVAVLLGVDGIFGGRTCQGDEISQQPRRRFAVDQVDVVVVGWLESRQDAQL